MVDQVYLGGVPEKFGRSHHQKALALPDIATNSNFIVCIKNVRFEEKIIKLNRLQEEMTLKGIKEKHFEFKNNVVNLFLI